MGDAHISQFNFIREFARYGIGEYPVFYCRPSFPAVAVSTEDLKSPMIRFTDHSEEIMKEFGFYSYYFMSHTIAMPVIRTYELTITDYFNLILKGERPMFDRIISLKCKTLYLICQTISID